MTAEESRREPRYPLPGLQVAVRRAGWKPGGGYHTCRLLDLSASGLAFAAHDDGLRPLDRIDFRFPVGGCEAEGRAVVCYRRPEGNGLWRYGVMFLEVTPDIEVLLQEVEIDSGEIRAAARALAEEAVLARCATEEDRRLWRRRLVLQDAVNAWLGRLRELDCQPPLTVTLERDGALRLIGRDSIVITAVPGRPGFASDRGDYFASVFEVLEFLKSLLGP